MFQICFVHWFNACFIKRGIIHVSWAVFTPGVFAAKYCAESEGQKDLLESFSEGYVKGVSKKTLQFVQFETLYKFIQRTCTVF
jgi:hypothetical protein